MLDIKPSHKPIKGYYEALKEFEKHGVKHETSVRNAFQELLTTYARKKGWVFFEEEPIRLASGTRGSVDGVIKDQYSIVMGYWEAKDSGDDLGKEVKIKFDKGYPKTNILFQEPKKAILYQDGTLIDDYDLTNSDDLVSCLRAFFEYKQEELDKWEDVVEQFKERIPESARRVIEMIEEEKRSNTRFKQAFQNFAELCRQSINPNLSDAAIEEMLVQHLLTSRIFESVFDRRDFDRRNIIAREIEHVIDALTSREFSREKFFKPLDHFYSALERRAKSIDDWSQKQHFLNAVYEKFFQGFSVKVADTHGIVYTPQPIVDFMVKSVNHILKTEFGRSLGDEGVHILDPFTGTGNFIMRIMKEIPKTKLPKKYAGELHCNEIMLLPYYIASMNIEHEYFEQTGEYKPFEGICLVDTFELSEGRGQMNTFSDENNRRIEKQKDAPIFVVIGNPPYNIGQANENDSNKNRKYPDLERQIASTYRKYSKATNTGALNDAYVKAFRIATNKIIKDGGLVAFVSNNSFLTEHAFDGMRKDLADQYDKIYLLDLGGNVRKNPKLSGTTHNVFGIQVGVSIAFLSRHPSDTARKKAKLYYARLDEFAKKFEKYRYLENTVDCSRVEWQELTQDESFNWLSTTSSGEYSEMCGLADDGQHSIFADYSNGITTNRDAWVYNFHLNAVKESVKKLIENYNAEVYRIKPKIDKEEIDIEEYITNDETKIKWSSSLKSFLHRGIIAEYAQDNFMLSDYRPFTRQWLYLDKVMTHRRGHWHRYIPSTSEPNRSLVVPGAGNRKGFGAFVTMHPASLDFAFEKTQCFPFYTYDKDGTNRRENITDWALAEFNSKLKALKVKQAATKWDIFYYVYGILHHPEYRTKYAANLRRELPRVPVSADFFTIAELGKKLADLHVNYEEVKPYELEQEWKKGSGLNLRVEKMKLSKDKRDVIYNQDLTLRGVPPEVFEYKLGNRSALDWIIDQYQVSTDKRSGITNDPNREDDPEYILQLLQKVITVSLETVTLVQQIAKLRMV